MRLYEKLINGVIGGVLLIEGLVIYETFRPKSIFEIGIDPSRPLVIESRYDSRFGSSSPEIHQLETQPLSIPRIFVGNDALAFFDVENPPQEPINVAEIVGRGARVIYRQTYNMQ